MLKENVSNIYSDLLEQYNILLDGDKSNRSLCSRAKNIYQVLDPVFGNNKDGLLTNRLNISSVLYTATTEKPIAKLLENIFIRPSCIPEKYHDAFDRAISVYLYFKLIKQSSILKLNDLIKLLKAVIMSYITTSDIKEIITWYRNYLSGVILYLQYNFKLKATDINPSYPVEIHYVPKLERIGVTFVYKRR